LFTDNDVYNFYLTKFDKILFTEQNTVWTEVTSDINQTTGYFNNAIDFSLLKVGNYATNTLKYLKIGANIKFVPPSGQAFKQGKLVTADSTDPEQRSYIWTKVVNVVGDGTNAGRGSLSSGLGPITFNENIPTGAIASKIVPKFVSDLNSALESEMVTQVAGNLNFGLRYDNISSSWKIVQTQNLDLTSSFSLGRAGDTSNENLDASWIMAFVRNNDQYVVRVRTMDYVFGSVQQNRFYFDKSEKAYNNLTGQVIKDHIKVLSINSDTNSQNSLGKDYTFEISDSIEFEDGYESTKEIKLSFSDNDDDGVVDDPETFEAIAGDDLELNFLFFEEKRDQYGTKYYDIIDNSNNTILVYQKQSLIDINQFDDGQLIYFYDSAENKVKSVNRTTNTLELQSQYKAVYGRRNLKFQYIHAASEDRRIDPSLTNIIDMYILTRSYDTSYRNYLLGVETKPDEPTTDGLRIEFGSNLGEIKSISDEIVYHPVKYKVLFGSAATEKLRAQFKIVKNPGKTINDNNLKVRIVNAINDFFAIDNWDFGDRFYLSELTTYVVNSVSPDITNFIILPRQTDQVFGSLFEIQSKPDEIFVSGATVDDIEIVASITAAEIRVGANSVVSST